jgi:hypothetical protein
MQAICFMKADLLWLLGRRREAKVTGRAGIDLAEEPLASGMTGFFCRWSALTAKKPDLTMTRLDRLKQIYSTKDGLDAIDKVEVACSLMVLQHRLGMHDPSIALEMRKDLAELPPACARQLALLGVLVPNRRPQSLPKTPL